MKVYPGTIAVADKDGFHRLPWYESITPYGPTGGEKPGTTKWLPGKRTSQGQVQVDPVQKRTPNERAEDLALRFVNHLQAAEIRLGRPLTPDDLTDEEYRAYGAEFWRSGEPVTVETMKRVASIYLEANRTKLGSRFSPGGGR